MAVVFNFNMQERLINKSTHSVTIDKVRYTILLGHYSKGSEGEKYAKNKFIDRKLKSGIVWYGEVIRPNVNGFSTIHGISKEDVISKLVTSISSGDIWVIPMRERKIFWLTTY